MIERYTPAQILERPKISGREMCAGERDLCAIRAPIVQEVVFIAFVTAHGLREMPHTT